MRNLCLVLIMALLSGCMNVATSGAQAVYNRKGIERTVSDQYITMQAYQALNHNTKEFSDCNITLSTYRSEVLLAGQVRSSWQKYQAEMVVKGIDGVSAVNNLLVVGGSSSTLTKMSDIWLTTKVKGRLIASNDVDASEIKVVTENGTVYLMGLVKPEEGQAAAEIASQTAGVQSVVKLFYYLHIDKNSKA